MISYCANLTGEDLSCYLNKAESVGIRSASDLTASAANVYIFLSYIWQTKQ